MHTRWIALGRVATSSLKVLSGHPRGVPSYFVEFLRAAWDYQEAVRSVARKNATTVCRAVPVLAYMAGPLRLPG